MTETTAKRENEYFAERVKTLGRGELVALRRAFGSTLSEADGNALTAFYKICPTDERKEEAAYLSACAIAYILHYKADHRSLAGCLKAAEVSESRIKALLGNKSIDPDGFFHSKFSRLIRYSVSKGFIPDINEIYPALTEWRKYRISFTKQYFSENIKQD